METPRTQAVLLTPPGRSAVATILLAGPHAVDIAGEMFCPATPRAIATWSAGRIGFGRWGDAQGEDVVLARTGVDCLEIHCHGGEAAAAAILADVRGHGADVRTWSAWLHAQEWDAIRTAARIALGEARTERGAAILLDQYQGALRGALEKFVQRLVANDYGEALVQLNALLSRARAGLHLTAPFSVVLAGPPNVGKSSLINALLGYERAIVFDQPGTTRDVVTALTAFDGWPVELSDTAGLREGAELLEMAGIARARQQLARADVVVLVFDGTRAWSHEDERLAAEWPEAIVVCSKADASERQGNGRLWTSAATGEGLGELQQRIAAKLVSEELPAGTAMPFTKVQLDVLAAARNRLLNQDAKQALAEVGKLLE